MNKIRKTMLALSVAMTTPVIFAGVAGAATPPSAGEVVGEMADEGISEILGIFSTNAGKVVVLAALAFGVNWVLRVTRKGGKSAT